MTCIRAHSLGLAFRPACRKDMIKFLTGLMDKAMPPADPMLRDCWPRKPEFGGARSV
jgi:hypothetical protein